MHHSRRRANRPARPVFGTGMIHVLTLALYAGFAIPVTLTALDEFWVAGVGLAAVFAVFWPKTPKAFMHGVSDADVDSVAPAMPSQDQSQPGSSGNASFDAYRAEMLKRLEQEQGRFEDFLHRLRDAKDKVEFEEFMEDRARVARAATGAAPTSPAQGSGTPELRQPI